MTMGVSGFIGERLVEAREAREIMTQSALAGLLGVSNRAISQYENNKISPRPEIVTELANLLKVKESFFFMPLLQKEPNPIFWRSRHVTVKDSRTLARRKFDWSKWLIDVYLKTYLDTPELNFPSRKETNVSDNPKCLTDNQIEQITLIVREFWGLGLLPIDNMCALLENNGVLLTYCILNSEKLDAFSNQSEYDGSFHIRLSTDKGSAVRSRFDAAHELGHLILHSHLPASYFNDKTHNLIESQANRFASAFLLPAESFKKDIWMPSIEAFRALKCQWKVSVGAMIKRCDDIGLFGDDESKVQRMWLKYKRDWRAIEQDDIAFEQPQLMKRCIDTLLDARVKTKSQILFDVPFNQNDIETLLNLPEGYLSEDFGILKHFPVIKSVGEASTPASGQVIPFDNKRKFDLGSTLP
jgi:Zn-dependent peptidase ImmA (M78 family)/transcriptional regulator with XRE-family HTH domain